FTGFKPPLVDQSTVSCDEATAQDSRFCKFHILRQTHQVLRRIRYSDVFGKSPLAGKARLIVLIADLLIAAGALPALPASHAEGQGDAITGLPALYRSAK